MNKRPSGVPTNGRTVSTSGAGPSGATGTGTVENPWEDVPPSPTTARRQQQQVVSHRLSFDPASGVIMLPDDGTWLDDGHNEHDEVVEGESSDDSDFGEEVTNGRSQTEPTVPTLNSLGSPGGGGGGERTSRYGTYFHHPERRRSQAIPGAFPRS